MFHVSVQALSTAGGCKQMTWKNRRQTCPGTLKKKKSVPTPAFCMLCHSLFSFKFTLLFPLSICLYMFLCWWYHRLLYAAAFWRQFIIQNDEIWHPQVLILSSLHCTSTYSIPLKFYERLILAKQINLDFI